jgi:hypothetical protein
LAYAIEERASGEKAANARILFNRFSASCWVGSGVPINALFSLDSIDDFY